MGGSFKNTKIRESTSLALQVFLMVHEIIVILAVPSLILDNILPLLDTNAWEHLRYTLYVPGAVLEVIRSEYPTDKERTTAVVLYWLLRDPLASWRRLISALDQYDVGIQIADKMRNFAEKITGKIFGRIVVIMIVSAYPAHYIFPSNSLMWGFSPNICSETCWDHAVILSFG